MKFAWLLALALLAGCAEAPPEISEGQAPPVEGRGQLSAYIFTDGLRAISGATVQFPELGVGTTTNENGYFAFSNMPLGAHGITVEASGYETHNGTVVVQEGVNEVQITLREIFEGFGRSKSDEFTLFVECQVSAVTQNLDCGQNKDSEIRSYEGATLIVDIQFSQSGDYRVVIGDFEAVMDSGRLILRNGPWDNLELSFEPLGLLPETGNGIGPHLAITADFYVTQLVEGENPNDY